MHHEQIDPLLDCHLHRPPRGIDGRADFRHCPGVLDLESVKGVRIILDLGKAQSFVGKADHLSERGHGAICRQFAAIARF